MSLQQHLDSISAVVQDKVALGESLKITLGYRQENGYIEPVGSFEMPKHLPENAIRAVFYEMLERQQQKELDAFRNLWENRGVEFDFHSRHQLATLTLFKEKSLEEDNKSKDAKASKSTKAKRAKAGKKSAAKKADGSPKSTRGRKGYSDEQRAEVLNFIKANQGRGVLKAASAKFKVSYPTVNLWVKSAGISPKSPKGPKAGKSAGTKKTLSGVILLNGVKYIPLASVKSEKPAKAAKVPKANKGLARAVKAFDKALAILKKSV